MKNLTHKRNFSYTASKLKPDLIVVPTATAATLGNVINPLFAVLIGSACFIFGVIRYGDVVITATQDLEFMPQYLNLAKDLNTWVLSNAETMTRAEIIDFTHKYADLHLAHTQAGSEISCRLDSYSIVDILRDSSYWSLRLSYYDWVVVAREMNDTLLRLLAMYQTVQ